MYELGGENTKVTGLVDEELCAYASFPCVKN